MAAKQYSQKATKILDDKVDVIPYSAISDIQISVSRRLLLYVVSRTVHLLANAHCSGPHHFFIFSKDGIHVGVKIDLISQRDIPLNTEYYILWSPKTEVSSYCTDEIRHSSLYCRTDLV
jgi:hypothetical protein